MYLIDLKTAIHLESNHSSIFYFFSVKPVFRHRRKITTKNPIFLGSFAAQEICAAPRVAENFLQFIVCQFKLLSIEKRFTLPAVLVSRIASKRRPRQVPIVYCPDIGV